MAWEQAKEVDNSFILIFIVLAYLNFLPFTWITYLKIKFREAKDSSDFSTFTIQRNGIHF